MQKINVVPQPDGTEIICLDREAQKAFDNERRELEIQVISHAPALTALVLGAVSQVSDEQLGAAVEHVVTRVMSVRWPGMPIFGTGDGGSAA